MPKLTLTLTLTLILILCSLFLFSCASNKIVAKNCEELEEQDDYYLCEEI